MTRNETTDFTGLLAQQAIRIALQGAGEYLRTHKLNADPEALRQCVKARCKASLDGALNDAKEAFECGMVDAAAATFSASMFLAGIEGAKEASNPITAARIGAQVAANRHGMVMVVVEDGLAENPAERFQFCPESGKQILFPHADQKVVATLKPEGR